MIRHVKIQSETTEIKGAALNLSQAQKSIIHKNILGIFANIGVDFNI